MIADDPVLVREEATEALVQVDRLNDTITELLSLAHDGEIGDVTEFGLHTLFVDHVQAWRPAFGRASRSLTLEIPDGVRVRSSVGALGQVLDVLLDNALRHGDGAVHVSSIVLGNGVLVRVSDQGSGITAADEKRIFERSVSTAGRSGVGLHLARMLMHAHGGRLELVQAQPPIFEIVMACAKSVSDDVAALG